MPNHSQFNIDRTHSVLLCPSRRVCGHRFLTVCPENVGGVGVVFELGNRA
jgi:hypothetical protein